MLKAVNVLTSYTKLCYVYVQFKQANQSCSPLKTSQSINVEWRTCDKNGWSFDKARNVLMEKIKIWAVENIFSLDFVKYLSYSEVQKNSKVVNI